RPVAKGNRAIEGYPILLGSIHEAPQRNGSSSSRDAQTPSSIPTAEESGSTRFLGRNIKAKKRRIRGPEISQYGPIHIYGKNVHLDKTVLGLANGGAECVGCLDTLCQDGLYLLRCESLRRRTIAKREAIVPLLIYSNACSQTTCCG